MADIRAELVQIVGNSNVMDTEKELREYTQDYSLDAPRLPNYVVSPANTDEVARIIKLANEHKIPVIPSSSGVHFYGATIPKQGGIVISLKNMNRILEIDETFKLMRIESGVTWGQLQPELEKRGYTSIVPLLPHPRKSVVTTWLEREVPVNCRYEYAEPLLTMELVWPTGDVFRTGSVSTPGAPTDSLVKGTNPQGPGLDWYRLFQGAQGTMGIVTWATIKIEHLPRLNKTFFIPFDELEPAIEFIYRLQYRMIGSECLLLNNLNLATMLAQDWPEEFERLRNTLPKWGLILILSGAPRRPEGKIAYEEEALKEVCSQLTITSLLSGIPGMSGIEKELPQILRRSCREGEPYWKHRYKGGCQEIFFITKLNKVAQFNEIIKNVAVKYGYPLDEIGCYIQPIEQGRGCHCEFDFYYDPGNTNEMELIRKFYIEAAESLLNGDALFTRPYGVLADLVYQRAAGYTMLLKKIKDLFDPNHIMNPGRLCL